MSNKKNIENIFKEQLENFEVEPRGDLWTNIRSELNNPIPSPEPITSSSKLAAVTSSSWMSTILVSTIIIGTIVGGYLYFDTKTENNPIKGEELETKVESKPKISEEEAQQVNSLNQKSEVSDNSNSKIDVSDKPENLTVEVNKDIKAPLESKSSKEDLTQIEAIDTEKKSVNLNTETEVSGSNSVIQENSTLNEDSRVFSDDKNIASNTNNSSIANTPKTQKEKEQLDQNSNNSQDELTEPTKEELTREELKNYQLPNIFTPNQDGANDFFEINANEIGIDGIEVNVFDRTGNLIKSWKTLYDKWDGTLNDGTAAPRGLYLYQIILKKEGIEVPRKGVITLNR